MPHDQWTMVMEERENAQPRLGQWAKVKEERVKGYGK
jgi:hypothetical protein